MPKTDSPKPADNDVEKLFQDILPEIPTAVRQACRSLGHHPDQMEFDGLVQRIALLLIDNDFHTLRSFDNRSEPQTWLFTIARRYVLRRLDEQNRMLSLDDMLPDFFTSQPDQEDRLISEEKEKRLLAAVGKLTKHEQKLFHLITLGLKAEEVAKRMGIKRESVHRKRNALKERLRKIINE